MMSAREYLGQYLIARKRITKLQGELRSLRDLCEQVTVDPTSEKVQSSGSKDRLGDVVARICDKELEIMDQVIEALDIMNGIEETISSLDDPDEQIVLQTHYIEGKEWSEIELELHMSKSTLLRTRDRAIEKIERF